MALTPGSVITEDNVTVIDAKSSGGQFVVLGIWRSPTHWATWIYDQERDTLFNGRYHWSLSEAVDDFESRA